MDHPKVTYEYAQKCIDKFRTTLYQRYRSSKFLQKSYREEDICYYDKAKEHETKTRDLKKALQLYVKAAINGQKTNSCIKDFASVLHQSGFTYNAIKFLDDMKEIYRGDKTKYEKLIANLSAQIKPTMKHECKNLLFDLVDAKIQCAETLIPLMFTSPERIRSIKRYNDLGFQKQSINGRYIKLSFSSFSAAKKTLESFINQQWYGYDKYWLDINNIIVTQAFVPQYDFEIGLVFQKGNFFKFRGNDISKENIQVDIPNFSKILKLEGVELVNENIKFLIQNKWMVARALRN